MRPLFAAPLLSLLTLVSSACSGGNAASQIANAPTFDPKGQTKCGVTKSQAHPLIVEWPAADRQELESRTKRGLVAVKYVGCEMQVLSRCEAPKGASYRYVATEAKEEELRIATSDELYANLPVGAARLEGRLENGGKLGVDMTMVGRYEAERSKVSKSDLIGDCGEATHFVSGFTVGAFDFTAEARASVGGGAAVGGIGAGADSKAEKETLSRDGKKASCDKATGEDTRPPSGCAALLRVEVFPLDANTEAPMEKASAPAAPAAAAPAPPVVADTRPPPPAPPTASAPAKAVEPLPLVQTATEKERVSAKKHYTAGKEAQANLAYAVALDQFTSAEQLIPAIGTEYLIAQCRDKLGQIEPAIAAYELFLGHLAARNDPKNHQPPLPMQPEAVNARARLAALKSSRAPAP